MATVVLDPGHGGTENIGGSSPNNATGPCGLLEKTVTLAVALATRDALQAEGAKVLLTRDHDVNLSLSARAAVAKREGGRICFDSLQWLDRSKNPRHRGLSRHQRHTGFACS
jgi:N-acetylmuramoyl-L-alanine amidase